jgi:solute carrier family 25 phosphate transporter 23/24/25/41
MKVNPEGDVQISDDSITGLGIIPYFLNILFGSIISIAKLPPQRPYAQFDTGDMYESYEAAHLSNFPLEVHPLPPQVDSPAVYPLGPAPLWTWDYLKQALISCVPNPGYFVAGGLAGIVSRTSTAPLDRLKVYLIAQTGVAQEAVSAAKSGAIMQAAKSSWRPLANATKELWAAGGIRSLYAGKFLDRRDARPPLTPAGNGLNVVKVMPESAIKFGSYEVRPPTSTSRFRADHRRLLNASSPKLKGIMIPARSTHGRSSSPVVLQAWSPSMYLAPAHIACCSPLRFAVYPLDTVKL